MTSKPVILLNAPPNAGKDTIAAEISKRLGLPKLEFKGKLFEIALCISGLTQSEWDFLYSRDCKDSPSEKLWGLTPREFMIDVSERMVKPLAGDAYFGLQLAMQALDGGVVSDSGFDSEADALSNIVGRENLFCIQFNRDGCSFAGDSRKFIQTDSVGHYFYSENNGSIQEFVDIIMDYLKSRGVS